MTMLTRWGRALDPNAVLPEYPRPQLVRGSYINLNGYWDYAITRGNDALYGYDGQILVPFSPAWGGRFRRRRRCGTAARYPPRDAGASG